MLAVQFMIKYYPLQRNKDLYIFTHFMLTVQFMIKYYPLQRNKDIYFYNNLIHISQYEVFESEVYFLITNKCTYKTLLGAFS